MQSSSLLDWFSFPRIIFVIYEVKFYRCTIFARQKRELFKASRKLVLILCLRKMALDRVLRELLFTPFLGRCSAENMFLADRIHIRWRTCQRGTFSSCSLGDFYDS